MHTLVVQQPARYVCLNISRPIPHEEHLHQWSLPTVYSLYPQRIAVVDDDDEDAPLVGPAPPPEDDNSIPYESNEMYAVPAGIDQGAYYQQQYAAAYYPEALHPAGEASAGAAAQGNGGQPRVRSKDQALLEAAIQMQEGGGRKGIRLDDIKFVEVGGMEGG